MRDSDIRGALRGRLREIHKHEEDTLIIDELGLCEGDARIDLAVVNGSLSGYEIKSELDTLQRLPHQADVYSRLLDQITVVSSCRHLEKAKSIVPDWWGLTEVFERDGTVEFNVFREPQNNPSVDVFSLVQLLWRDEALALLTELGLQKGVLSKSRHIIRKRLCEATTLSELSALVRRQLKARESWRSARLPVSNDDSSLLSSRSPNCRGSLCDQHTS
jgi:hypothetical protein